MDIKYIKDHSSNTEFYPATHVDAVVGLKNVAKTGSYNDLTDTPTIPDEYDDTELSGRVSTIEGKESGWDAKYDKPSGGIPSSDLSSAVLASLGKADTALLSFTETDPTVPDWAKATTKPSYAYSEITNAPTTLSSFTDDLGTNPTHTHSLYLTEHLDISGKVDTTVFENSNAVVSAALNELHDNIIWEDEE